MNERAKISRKKVKTPDISYPSLAPKIPGLAVPKNDSNSHSAIPLPETVQRDASVKQENQEDTGLKQDSFLENINYLENISIHRPQQVVQRQEIEEEKEESEQGEVVQAKCNECDRQQEKQEEGELVQTKLTVGEAGDKYEQEADSVAAKVVEQINSPKSEQPVQGKIEPVVQPTVMRQGGIGGATVNEYVEQNIQQARGSGQELADNILEPI